MSLLQLLCCIGIGYVCYYAINSAITRVLDNIETSNNVYNVVLLISIQGVPKLMALR